MSKPKMAERRIMGYCDDLFVLKQFPWSIYQSGGLGEADAGQISMSKRESSNEGASPVPTAGGERRIALVIGNSAYKLARLRNPHNDALAFRDKLRAVHPPFDADIVLDARRDEMENALEKFEEKIAEGCDIALLFFAGHGLQVKRRQCVPL